MVRFARSIEVESECDDGDKDFFLHHCHGGKVVRFFVPVLAGAHPHSLPRIVAHDHLNQILVTLLSVFVKASHHFLPLFCQLFDALLDLIRRGNPVSKAFVDHSLKSRTGLLMWAKAAVRPLR